MDSVNKELAHSLLDTAGSMRRLTDELDRLSLHSMNDRGSPLTSSPRRSYKDHNPHWLADWPTVDSTSAADSPISTGSMRQSRQRRASRSSSKYDSAIGTLHSQTDEETSSQLTDYHPEHRPHRAKRADQTMYSQSDWDWLGRTRQESRRTERHILKVHKRRSSSENYVDKSASSSAISTPTQAHNSKARRKLRTTRAEITQSPVLDLLRREGSTRSSSSTGSFSSNSSKRSSGVLTVGLSEDDILQMAKLSSELDSPSNKRKGSTVIRTDFVSPQEQHAEVVYIPPEHTDSDSSSSTVVDHSITRKNEAPPTASQAALSLNNASSSAAAAGGPLTPDIVVVNVQQPHSGTNFYQDSLSTPKSTHKTPIHYVNPNPRVPKRYRDAGDSSRLAPADPSSSKGNRPPKRSASFLQRLKLRRGTSFKTERKPKKRVPVRRSFSDRIMYQIRKGWVDYEEDLNFISNPSQLRRIGRLIDKQAGRLHLVQLHRPPSGRYGIYISCSALRRGIFVSRFADTNTAKFYSGLIAPGDEIVKVNRERVREKSVDYVYDLMAKLDSVVFTILPVNSRPDW